MELQPNLQKPPADNIKGHKSEIASPGTEHSSSSSHAQPSENTRPAFASHERNDPVIVYDHVIRIRTTYGGYYTSQMPLSPESRATIRDKEIVGFSFNQIAVNFAASGASGALTLDRRTEAPRRQWLVGPWKKDTSQQSRNLTHALHTQELRSRQANPRLFLTPPQWGFQEMDQGPHEKTTLADVSAGSDWVEQRRRVRAASAQRRFPTSILPPCVLACVIPGFSLCAHTRRPREPVPQTASLCIVIGL
ncbi:hypothetical protein CMUS01_08882 [Colletotrichum musicola]|uniref:Uncharacterized protein n=1 Tax=Colletotrichum musicola TaxID=2175873 RepID=A0A8H6KB94_9PEZI|nr:hypothetical protein CMUS01_08882 [Colletotrichum musicola]